MLSLARPGPLRRRTARLLFLASCALLTALPVAVSLDAEPSSALTCPSNLKAYTVQTSSASYTACGVPTKSLYADLVAFDDVIRVVPGQSVDAFIRQNDMVRIYLCETYDDPSKGGTKVVDDGPADPEISTIIGCMRKAVSCRDAADYDRRRRIADAYRYGDNPSSTKADKYLAQEERDIIFAELNGVERLLWLQKSVEERQAMDEPLPWQLTKHEAYTHAYNECSLYQVKSTPGKNGIGLSSKIRWISQPTSTISGNVHAAKILSLLPSLGAIFDYTPPAPQIDAPGDVEDNLKATSGGVVRITDSQSGTTHQYGNYAFLYCLSKSGDTTCERGEQSSFKRTARVDVLVEPDWNDARIQSVDQLYALTLDWRTSGYVTVKRYTGNNPLPSKPSDLTWTRSVKGKKDDLNTFAYDHTPFSCIVDSEELEPYLNRPKFGIKYYTYETDCTDPPYETVKDADGGPLQLCCLYTPDQPEISLTVDVIKSAKVQFLTASGTPIGETECSARYCGPMVPRIVRILSQTAGATTQQPSDGQTLQIEIPRLHRLRQTPKDLDNPSAPSQIAYIVDYCIAHRDAECSATQCARATHPNAPNYLPKSDGQNPARTAPYVAREHCPPLSRIGIIIQDHTLQQTWVETNGRVRWSGHLGDQGYRSRELPSDRRPVRDNESDLIELTHPNVLTDNTWHFKPDNASSWCQSGISGGTSSGPLNLNDNSDNMAYFVAEADRTLDPDSRIERLSHYVGNPLVGNTLLKCVNAQGKPSGSAQIIRVWGTYPGARNGDGKSRWGRDDLPDGPYLCGYQGLESFVQTSHKLFDVAGLKSNGGYDEFRWDRDCEARCGPHACFDGSNWHVDKSASLPADAAKQRPLSGVWNPCPNGATNAASCSPEWTAGPWEQALDSAKGCQGLATCADWRPAVPGWYQVRVLVEPDFWFRRWCDSDPALTECGTSRPLKGFFYDDLVWVEPLSNRTS